MEGPWNPGTRFFTSLYILTRSYETNTLTTTEFCMGWFSLIRYLEVVSLDLFRKIKNIDRNGLDSTLEGPILYLFDWEEFDNIWPNKICCQKTTCVCVFSKSFDIGEIVKPLGFTEGVSYPIRSPFVLFSPSTS